MARYIYIYGEAEDVIIGQEAGLACIVRNPDGKSWRLIRLDDDARIKVNLEDLHLVHYLSPGDMIETDGQTLRFVVRDSDHTTGYGRDIKRLKRLSAASAISVAAIGLIILCLYLWNGYIRPVRLSDIGHYVESICKLSTVEVLYQQVEMTENSTVIKTLDSMKLNSASCSGTGFFCTNGMFVTARHCVEPWIGISDPANATDKDYVRWAIDAETFNICEAVSDSVYRRVIAKCEIYRGNDVIHTFSTDTCLFSIENDIVHNLCGRLDPRYWRSLGTINRSSSLGDIVSVNAGIKGNIIIAGEKVMKRLKTERQAAHYGYEGSSDRPRFISSKLKYTPERHGGKIVRCLEHESINMEHGFSGSPALVRVNGRFHAIGVVSRTLENSSTFFSVPVSEFENLKLRWTE